MSDGTTSPPYPAETTNSRSLYRHLEGLRAWVVEQRDTLTPLVPERYVERIATIPDLQSEAFWDNVSVVDKYTVMTWLRKIREGWDMLLRQHEDAWDSKFALQKRYGVTVNAIHVLEQAFVDPETREHQQHQAATKARRQQRLIDEHLKQVLIPDELKDEVAQQTDSDEPGDDWFGDTDATEEHENQDEE